MRPTSRSDAAARTSELIIDLEETLTHACAALALAYSLRAAGFAATWIDVPVLAAPPREKLPMLSIVVPARDEGRSLETCLRSLLALEWLDFEVILVDDRSTDATPQIAERIARGDPGLVNRRVGCFMRLTSCSGCQTQVVGAEPARSEVAVS